MLLNVVHSVRICFIINRFFSSQLSVKGCCLLDIICSCVTLVCRSLCHIGRFSQYQFSPDLFDIKQTMADIRSNLLGLDNKYLSLFFVRKSTKDLRVAMRQWRVTCISLVSFIRQKSYANVFTIKSLMLCKESVLFWELLFLVSLL